jgi:CRP-like cAMP-binding protein
MDWPLLQGLDDADRREVLATGRRHRFKRGEVLFREGEAANAMHLVAKGTVAARINAPSGDTVTVQVIGRGDVVGEMALVADAGVRTASVYALEPTETLALHRDDVDALRVNYPSVDRVLVTVLAAKLARVSTLMTEAHTVAADKRVLRRLLDLVPAFATAANDGRIVVPLSQDDLAGLAGTTRETVNRTLRDAQQAGLLAPGRGRVEIIDAEGLARRSR